MAINGVLKLQRYLGLYRAICWVTCVGTGSSTGARGTERGLGNDGSQKRDFLGCIARIRNTLVSN